jgi:hypothetical protein
MSDTHPGLVIEAAMDHDLPTVRALSMADPEAVETAHAEGALRVVLERPAQLERCPDCDTRDDCELRESACDAIDHPRRVVAALRCGAEQGGWLVDRLWFADDQRKRLIKRSLIALRRAAREAGVTRIELDGGLLRMPERLQARNLGFAPAARARLAADLD